jgi:hypothetical protein
MRERSYTYRKSNASKENESVALVVKTERVAARRQLPASNELSLSMFA